MELRHLSRALKEGYRAVISLNILLLLQVTATPFYYGTYRSYGTGDTVIATAHANGGPKTAFSKWQVECLDGEAMTGIIDNVFDFGGITNVWCKFMFPYKVSSKTLYPYYQYCHVRDYIRSYYCYDPRNHTTTANTFITGIWDNDSSFWVYRRRVDSENPYKCCKTPPGYYIDYVSCYYLLTHDQYWEYYDSQYWLITCASGYVMTGMSKKTNPIVDQEMRVEWIQCCRIGYGAIIAMPPPVIQTPNGGAVAYSSGSAITPQDIPADYAAQYRGKRSAAVPTAMHTNRHTMMGMESALKGDGDQVRSRMAETRQASRSMEVEVPGMGQENNMLPKPDQPLIQMESM